MQMRWLDRGLREIADAVELGAQVGLVEIPAEDVARPDHPRERRRIGRRGAEAEAPPEARGEIAEQRHATP